MRVLSVYRVLYADEPFPPPSSSSLRLFPPHLSRTQRPPCPQSEDASALRSAAHMSEEEHYMTMLVQTEVERIKFVVRSYVRTRLFKVRPHPLLPSLPTLF